MGVKENPPIQDLIWNSIAANLDDKGLQRTTSNGDLNVTFLGVEGYEIQVENIGGWPEARFYIGRVPIQGNYVRQGTLAVNLIDSKTRKSAWLAVCSDTINKPEELEAKVRKSLDKAFKKYPALKAAKN